MIKHYEISMNYKSIVISIDHDQFDEKKAIEALKKNVKDIEVYEGALDTILRWLGLEFAFCCYMGDRIQQSYIFYICNVLDVEYGTITLLKKESLKADLLDFSVCEVALLQAQGDNLEVNHE